MKLHKLIIRLEEYEFKYKKPFYIVFFSDYGGALRDGYGNTVFGFEQPDELIKYFKKEIENEGVHT